jgi:hypothetical protein
VNAKGRHHRHSDHRKIQEHDEGLTPGVLPETPFPGEPCTDQQSRTHADLQKQNRIDGGRSRRSKEPFSQQIVSEHTAANFLDG